MKNIFLSSKLFVILILFSTKCLAQISQLDNNGTTGSSAQYVGWDNNATYELRIRNDATQAIAFYTDMIRRIEITGSTGNVGIGNSANSLRLNVDNDINLNSSAWGHGYWIDTKLILSIPGIRNTLVGENAGNAIGSQTYQQSVCVGYDAGANLTSGSYNTYLGYQAGHDNETSHYNTFIGHQAGYSHQTGTANVFIGRLAGFQDQSGENNTFVGEESGQLNYSGSNNSFFGQHSGYSCTGNNNTYLGHHAALMSGDDEENVVVGSFAAHLMTGGNRNTIMGSRAGQYYEAGDENVIVGYDAGFYNTDGDSNVFVGRSSGRYNYFGKLNTYLGIMSGPPFGSNQNLTNAAAIGAYSQVLHNNEMIIGNNLVKAGIGLSGDATGPRAKLEINDGTTGVSGLQFRTLTSSYNPGSTATKFLTVDVDGKVILKDVPGGGGSVTACTGPLVLNKLSKWTSVGSIPELCNSLVYDNGTNVGVNNTSPAHQVDITGDLGISAPLYYSGARTIARDGTDNFYVGNNAGNTSTPNVAYGNTAVGASSLRILTNSAAANTSLGFQSGYNVTTGSANTLLGYRAGFNNSTGANNIAIGTDAASNGGSGVSLGSNNVIVGDYSGQNEEGDQNTFIGNYSGQTHETGDLNLFAGYNSNIYPGGSTTDTYENCVLLGPSSFVYNGTGTSTISNATAIGSNTVVGCKDCIVMGSISDFSKPNTRTLMGYYDIPASLGYDYRLYVKGMPGGRSAYFNGDAYCTGLFISSDANIKTSINNIDPETASDIIDNLEPKTYYFDTIANSRLNLPSGLQYGLLAQEVERILPSLVENQTAPSTKDSNLNVIEPEFNFKSINYIALVPILLQELKTQKEMIRQLQETVEGCCNNNSNSSGTKVRLSSESSIVLNQNDPNPFAEETQITFTIPIEIKDAKIIFINNTGRILQTVIINERGNGKINVFAENLSSGIYSYTLIADGKVIDSKKMVCNK